MANTGLVSTLVTAYSVLLLIAGAALLFAPVLAFPPLSVGVSPVARLYVQLFGAALVGFGVVGWTARGLALGGIYGRAVVAGQQAFAFVATLTLLGSPVPGRTYWPLLGLLAFGAAVFSVLLFRPRWLLRNDEARGAPDLRPPTPDR